MKRLITALCASMLLATSPAWAHGGHGHGHGKHRGEHAEKAFEKHERHFARHRRHFDDDDVIVVKHFHSPQPVVVRRVFVEPVSAPPPGVQVIFTIR